MTSERVIYQGEQYELQSFKLESELERLLSRNTQEIFGSHTYFFDAKKLVTSPGKELKTIPDGYLLDLKGEKPKLHLVEVELARHQAYKHVMVQVAKFNELDMESKVKIWNTLLPLIRKLKLKGVSLTKMVGDSLLKETLSPLPVCVVIDQITPAIEQALSKLESKPNLIQVKQFRSTKNHGKKKILHVYRPKLNTKSHITTVQSDTEEESQFFDFALEKIEAKFVAISKNLYRYSNDRVYIPQRTSSHPSVSRLVSFINGSKIRYLNSNKIICSNSDKKSGWHKQLELETSFASPLVKGKPIETSFEVEMKSPKLVPHIAVQVINPIKESLIFNVDLKNLGEEVTSVKLLEYFSEKASRPIVPSSLAETKSLDSNGKLVWEISDPKLNHIYLLTWKEPCDCNWCRYKIRD